MLAFHVASRSPPLLLISFRAWATWTLQPRSHIYGRNYSDAPMTKVEKIILDNIKATGPISFASYMQICLSHPTEGYYMNPSNAVFGSRGDFTTSPEISQVFGELVGIWLLSQWMNAGQSRKIRLIELGPGRGTLMDDILRVVNQFPASRSALSCVHLIDNSLAMQAIQKEKLRPASKGRHWEILWHDSLDEVPQAKNEYTMLVAHEFFDALPIHVLQRTGKGWHEVLISDTPGVAADSPSVSPPLSCVLSPSPTSISMILGLSSPRFQALPIGSRIEVSHVAFKIARKIGQVLGSGTTSRGSALIVDYGGDKAYGDSFRAFKDHKIVDIFHRPGECDLTANVNFTYLKEGFEGLANPHGPISQSIFLTRMGMHMRVEALKHAAKTQKRKDSIDEAARRLVDTLGMGNEYQVLGVTSHGRRAGDAGTAEDVWPFMDISDSV